MARELGISLLPLKNRLEEAGFVGLISELGLQLPPVIAEASPVISESSNMAASLSSLPDDIETLVNAIDDEDTEQMLITSMKLTNTFADIISSIDKFADSIDSISSSSGLSTDEKNQLSAFTEHLARRLLDFLIIEYFKTKSSGTVATLGVLGLIDDYKVEPNSSDSLQPPYQHRAINFDNIKTLVSDPENYMIDVFDFGKPDFDGSQLFPRIKNFLEKTDVDSIIVETSGLDPFLEAYLFRLSVLSSKSPPGLDARLRLPAVEDFEQTYRLSDLWSLVLKVAARFNSGLSIQLAPPLNVDFDLLSGSVEMDVSGGFKAEYPDRRIVLLAEPGLLELGLQRIGLTIGINSIVNADSKAALEPFATIELKGAKLQIGSSSGDGFIQSILGEINLESDFDLGGQWQPSTGMQFHGSGGIEISIPTYIDLGVIQLNTFHLGGTISTDDSPINFETSVDITTKLGPVTGVVERMGAQLGIDFPDDQSGNLGPLNLTFTFKPPNGVGLAVDAGPVKGGGYLFFDFDREEYAGALELVFSDWIALKAIGLITTKMPDGSRGFSMLIIITVEFGTGIQLGFGFTLNGVGGLLGINRIVSIESLKDGIRTGSVESIMFPKDVVENAPRIISDLRKFFPPQNDAFLVGPMAKIGWGTPTLIDISIGIILELPNVDITILGVVKVILPDEKADVLRLQVNFIGRIEPSNERLWFYAVLFDSRVLFITLEGGMGLLVNWGNNANFVVSVGGFHPRYKPPPLPFPEPTRISAIILNESNAKVRIDAYFAVTSNTVQFGARAELFFGVSEFKIEGFLAFDALFQFDPFFFSFSLSISLSVKVFGVGMFSVGFSGILEGPTPWYIEGKGKISLLFFKIKVPFSHTWGKDEDTKLDPIAVFPLIEKELNALTNWEAWLPESSSTLVSLRELGESFEDQLVLHPIGTLRISQRKVPLNFNMDKVGNQRPSDVNKLKLKAAVNGGGNMVVSDIEEQFAIGQYKDIEDSGRLSSAAFEPLNGGVEVAVEGEQIKTSQAVKRVIRYESIIIDSYYKRFIKPFFSFFANGFSFLHEALHQHFLAGSAVRKSVLSNQHKKRMQPFDEVIEVKPHEYSVAFNTDNKPMGENGTVKSFTSQAKAKEFMEQKIHNDAKFADQLHVIPNTEINTAA
ncbi:hypothetical protein DYD21_10570 [Rhodohalobacter sp. SW132]|uniref:DUF6603 domain-containing protein n=1 Tax=Rhodohalobacter sp. SW132 TaxID=2293433 RepID=UPI000E24E5DC|nr:DUF6603 domain-containing protein [Rhodohalobacter sp. SW132]REL33840.1 hypothetical protein DYD21_10570 [Rhodohalobacter sp. SW132]